MSEDGSCGALARRQLEKGRHFVAITKKDRQFFSGGK